MNGLPVADLGGADEGGDVEIAVDRRRRADADGLVGEIQVGRAAIGLAEDGDDLDAQVAAGPDDPERDFTAIGDEDALKHSEIANCKLQIANCQLERMPNPARARTTFRMASSIGDLQFAVCNWQ